MWRNKKAFLANRCDENDEEKSKLKSDKLLPLDNNAFSEDEDLLLSLDQASGKTSVPIDSKYESESDSNEDNMTIAHIKLLLSMNKKMRQF
ncbi:hypothetical protein HHI36_020082 [Cryptolaemus montrouzieri]|uniref:Uncharacterized protein n=1 Tax=Cryptolaemus montrouzieri TaxID=559131 RepID=A0ABD2NA97_9CUCU